MRNQSQLLPITRFTDRVQPITEVPAPVLRQEVPVHLHQVQVITGAVHRRAAAAAVEVSAQEAAAEEVVAVHIPEVPVVALQAAAVHVQEAVVHLHRGADNYRKL